jgi:hypothetical protein
LSRACFIISAAYWLVVGAVLLRRRKALTRVDLWFIAIGYPAMLLAGLTFGPSGSRYFDWQRFGSW